MYYIQIIILGRQIPRRRGQGLGMRIGVKTRRISIIGEENDDGSRREDEEEDVGKSCMTFR